MTSSICHYKTLPSLPTEGNPMPLKQSKTIAISCELWPEKKKAQKLIADIKYI